MANIKRYKVTLGVSVLIANLLIAIPVQAFSWSNVEFDGRGWSTKQPEESNPIKVLSYYTQRMSYTVKKNDTLWKISRQLGTSVDSLP
ncbi:LysM peptidoglycan-binding domain-containing protein [Desulfofarcimen acetoxidans]|uniref:LysM peptidoglycan-binding domain-containing protein n=1 Tax=Desulfofarcimen acetoxidans TaxID=58138 RepID=UPI00019E639D|nr:LysM peptidoglycan-binding domain-containing protein [Desulfofarcimen acetoxidans]